MSRQTSNSKFASIAMLGALMLGSCDAFGFGGCMIAHHSDVARTSHPESCVFQPKQVAHPDCELFDRDDEQAEEDFLTPGTTSNANETIKIAGIYAGSIAVVYGLAIPIKRFCSWLGSETPTSSNAVDHSTQTEKNPRPRVFKFTTDKTKADSWMKNRAPEETSASIPANLLVNALTTVTDAEVETIVTVSPQTHSSRTGSITPTPPPLNERPTPQEQKQTRLETPPVVETVIAETANSSDSEEDGLSDSDTESPSASPVTQESASTSATSPRPTSPVVSVHKLEEIIPDGFFNETSTNPRISPAPPTPSHVTSEHSEEEVIEEPVTDTLQERCATITQELAAKEIGTQTTELEQDELDRLWLQQQARDITDNLTDKHKRYTFTLADVYEK